MHKQKTARQIRTALRLAYGSGDMRLFQRTAQKQPLSGTAAKHSSRKTL